METGQGAGASTTTVRPIIPFSEPELAARARLVAPDLRPCPRPNCYRWWTLEPDEVRAGLAVVDVKEPPRGEMDERRRSPQASLPEALAMVRAAYARLEADEDNASRFAAGAARLASIAVQITRLQGTLAAESTGNAALDGVLSRLFAGLEETPAALPAGESGLATDSRNGDREREEDWLGDRRGYDLGDDDFD